MVYNEKRYLLAEITFVIMKIALIGYGKMGKGD